MTNLHLSLPNYSPFADHQDPDQHAPHNDPARVCPRREAVSPHQHEHHKTAHPHSSVPSPSQVAGGADAR